MLVGTTRAMLCREWLGVRLNTGLSFQGGAGRGGSVRRVMAAPRLVKQDMAVVLQETTWSAPC